MSSAAQKKAWFTELKGEFPGIPDDFIWTSVEAFDRDPKSYTDLFKKYNKLQQRAGRGTCTTTPLPSTRSVAQLEESTRQFEAQREIIERESKCWIVKNTEPEPEIIVVEEVKEEAQAEDVVV